MDLHHGFEEAGFLCEGITNGAEALRQENAEWFALAGDINAQMMKIASTARNIVDGTTNWAPQAVAVRLFLKTCGHFQAVLLLCERGMAAESRTLARSILESAFSVAVLLDQPETFVSSLKSDSEASRRNQAKFILAKQLAAGTYDRTKLQKAVDDIDKNATLMSPKRLAELGPLLNMYLYYQRLSDDSAHITARSLQRHIKVAPDRSGWLFRWGAATKAENAATLQVAIMAMLPVCIAVTQLLDDKANNTALAPLVDRFSAMPETDII